jgi:hypothetical protein
MFSRITARARSIMPDGEAAMVSAVMHGFQGTL